jgi:hypothetical protein
MADDLTRGSNGRFAKGNKGGPGNPYQRRCAKLKKALLDAVTDADFAVIAHNLVTKAKAGDLKWTRELLDRLFGRPQQAVNIGPTDGATFRFTIEKTYVKDDASGDRRDAKVEAEPQAD